MKALVGAFNQEKALVGAFSVIVQPFVEPMEHYTALPRTRPRPRPLQRAAAAAPPALLRARHGSAGGAVRHGQPGARRGIQVAISSNVGGSSYSLFSGFKL